VSQELELLHREKLPEGHVYDTVLNEKPPER